MQNVNPLLQIINQQFGTYVQAVTMSPWHMDHFESRTEMLPRSTVMLGGVKGHRHVERCRKILRHCD